LHSSTNASQPDKFDSICTVEQPVSVRTPSRLARVVRHRKRLHQQVADRETPLRIDQIERALLAVRTRFAQGGERTVRQPHRDTEAARQRKHAVAVVGVLVRDDYSGEIGRRKANASQARHGLAQRKTAVEHEARPGSLDDERVAPAAATKRSKAHAWFPFQNCLTS